jgi:hypothetical protein
MNDGMWETLQTLTNQWDVPIEHNNHDSWKQLSKLYPKNSMLFQHWSIGHAQYVWDVRQNPKVVDVFKHIWYDDDSFAVSFDGVSYHFPPETTGMGWYKQTKYYKDHPQFNAKYDWTWDISCIPGYINGYDTNVGDATLSFLEGSHKYHSKFASEFNLKNRNHWYELTNENLSYYLAQGCVEKRIRCPRGSLVLWDSRIVHCDSEPLQGRAQPNFKNVVYLCYLPRYKCSSSDIKKKVLAWVNKRMTTYWPCNVRLYPKLPQTHGGPIPTITELPKPNLTELGRTLACLN